MSESARSKRFKVLYMGDPGNYIYVTGDTPLDAAKRRCLLLTERVACAPRSWLEVDGARFNLEWSPEAHRWVIADA